MSDRIASASELGSVENPAARFRLKSVEFSWHGEERQPSGFSVQLRN